MAADKAAGECEGSRRGPPCPPRAWAAWCGRIRFRAGGGECRYVPGGRRNGYLACTALFPSAEEVVPSRRQDCGPPAAEAAGVKCRRGPPPVGLCPGGSPAGPCGDGALHALGEGGWAAAPSWPGRGRWGGHYGRIGGGGCLPELNNR